jgi:hypothetical protein
MRAEGHTPDLMTMNCLLAAHRHPGQWHHALAVAEHMLRAGDEGAWRRGAVDEYTCTALMQVGGVPHSCWRASCGAGQTAASTGSSAELPQARKAPLVKGLGDAYRRFLRAPPEPDKSNAQLRALDPMRSAGTLINSGLAS